LFLEKIIGMIEVKIMVVVKYRDVFSPDFLTIFGDQKSCVGDIVLADNKIDVKEVVHQAGYQIEFSDDINASGEYEDQMIRINSTEPEYRQRFTIAHELGHAVNGHSGKQYRATLVENDPELNQAINEGFEIVANKFAADLLMPRKLVISVMQQAMAKKSINPQQFDDDDFDSVVGISARKLDVSESAFRFRVKNLKLIRSNNHES